MSDNLLDKPIGNKLELNINEFVLGFKFADPRIQSNIGKYFDVKLRVEDINF